MEAAAAGAGTRTHPNSRGNTKKRVAIWGGGHRHAQRTSETLAPTLPLAPTVPRKPAQALELRPICLLPAVE